MRKDSFASVDQSKPIKKSPSPEKRDRDLPHGLKATEASSNLPDAEVRSLRQQANDQAGFFEVLQAKDVSMLSRVSLQIHIITDD